MKYVAIKSNVSVTKDNTKPYRISVDSNSISGEENQKKAIEAYKNGKLFNIALRGIGSIGDFEISKNRVYTNEAIIDAFDTFNSLINEYPYYRIMFDSHPSSESEENTDMGESNDYDDIGGYLLKLKLGTINIKGRNHKAITFDYVITKQSIIDYFMRSVDPVLAISHRGFMGDIKQILRCDLTAMNANVTYMGDVFKSLDFWNQNSEYIDYVGFLRLLGFDLVTYPADFLCQTRKSDIIGFNITDAESISKDNAKVQYVSENEVSYRYMLDKCVKTQSNSPFEVLRMKYDDNYLKTKLQSEKSFDEAKFILNNGEGIKMKINLDLNKLTDNEYMIGLFKDLDEMFVDINTIWDQDSEKVGEWISDFLKDEYKESKDEFIDPVKQLLDNANKFKDVYDTWYDDKILTHNKEIVQVMVDAIGVDKFKEVLGLDFKMADEDLKTLLDEYKEQENFTDIFESIGENLKSMADELDYFKTLATEVIGLEAPVADEGGTPEATTPIETPAESTTPVETPTVDNASTPVADENTPEATAPEDVKPVEDALAIAPDPVDTAWDGKAVLATITQIQTDQILSEDEFAQMIDEVFAIARCYDKQVCWKLPHHDVLVDGENVSVELNKAGLLAAAQAILGARSKMIASAEEKQAASDHLLKHFDEAGVEPPEGLAKVVENIKFLDLVTEGDLVLTLDDQFVNKIIKEDNYIGSVLSLDSEDSVTDILDSIYNIMKPFVKEGAQVTVDEEMFKKLAQTINNSAIYVAAVMNGEGSGVMNIDDNEIVAAMRHDIVALKEDLMTSKDQLVTMNREKTELITQNNEYSTKLEAMEKLSADVDHFTKLVDSMNKLNDAKLKLVFGYKNTIDEDIFNEVLASKDFDQLGMVEKWVGKMSNKKVVVTDLFNQKKDTVDTDQVTPSVNSGLLTPPKKDDKIERGTMTGSLVNDILKLIEA